MTDTMRTSEVLDKAADLLEGATWIQGQGWRFADSSEADAMCLEGALQAATGHHLSVPKGQSPRRKDKEFDRLTGCPAYMALCAYLDLEENEPLYRWNDENYRTQHEIVATLRAAALVEAARESRDALPETVVVQ